VRAVVEGNVERSVVADEGKNRATGAILKTTVTRLKVKWLVSCLANCLRPWPLRGRLFSVARTHGWHSQSLTAEIRPRHTQRPWSKAAVPALTMSFLVGSSRRQRHAGSPRNGEEEDRTAAEDPEGRYGDGDGECLRRVHTRSDEGRGAGANLRDGTSRTDR
jgi:hypothetical protein